VNEGDALEARGHAIRNEAAPRNQDVAVPETLLVGDEHLHRMKQVERVPGAGHRHIEQPPLLLDLLGGSGGHV